MFINEKRADGKVFLWIRETQNQTHQIILANLGFNSLKV